MAHRGRGTIIRNGRRYWVQLSIADELGGGRRRVLHGGEVLHPQAQGGFRSLKEAEKGRTALLRAIDQGVYVDPSRRTVAGFLSEWLTGMELRLRPSTFASYRMQVERYIVPRIGKVDLQRLRPAQVEAMYGQLLEAGRSRGPAEGSGRPPGLSVRTVRMTHTILRHALDDAVSRGELARNPVHAVKPPRSADDAPGSKIHTWTGAEVERFLAAVREDRLYGAWQLAATTGMRRGELLGLRWEDVDFDQARVEVRQTMLGVGGKIMESAPKTRRSRRSVALDRLTVAVLKAHRTRQKVERLAAGEAWQGRGLVFCRETGQPVSPDYFSEMFRQHVRRAGLPAIRLHDLRHTWATLALRAGIHPKVVSDRLGHSTIAITLDTYSHAIPAMQAEAAEQVAALIFG